MFVRIPQDILISVAGILAAQGHVLGDNTKVKIAECANENFPRMDGNTWKYPTGKRGAKRRGVTNEMAVFYPAFEAAEKPVVTPKAAKGTKALSKPRRAATDAEKLAAAQARAAYARSCKGNKAGKTPAPSVNAQVADLLAQAAALLLKS